MCAFDRILLLLVWLGQSFSHSICMRVWRFHILMISGVVHYQGGKDLIFKGWAGIRLGGVRLGA
jgi:hypothetical protein